MATPLSLRVVEAEARVYRRTWRGSVASSFLNPVLYMLAMGLGLGALVDANMPGGIDGVSYLTFLAPGILAANAMQTGATEGAWKVMGGIFWAKTWHARLASPISIEGLVLGHLLWSTGRVVMVSVIFAVVIAAFQVAPLFESLLAVGPAVLLGAAMVSATTAFTVRLKEQAGLPMFFRFVVLPMFLFSGAFFPISQLPNWLQPVALITPVYHGVELARSIVIGAPPAVTWWISTAYLAAWIVGFGLLCVKPLRKRLMP
ncbi:MAG: ABC transporter permease [Actinomycetota bacterium]|nr:ABC transporter permease [Actinomycetota bacterium]